MNPALDTEVLAALEEAGLRVRSFLRISKLRSANNGRITYRIEHEGGTVKARRLEDEATARDLAALRSGLPDAFTRVVSRHGRVLIEEWIEGDPLPLAPERNHLLTAGALLADLHASRTPGCRTLRAKCPTAAHRLRAHARLSRLAGAGALRKEEAAGLEGGLERCDPREAAYGLVHLDFCGENMVMDRAGRLRVVDNDRIRLDSLSFDLARTWYRWALTAPQWDAFCLAYTSRLPFPQPESLHFWKIVAAIQSAELRWHAYPEGAEVALRYLRALAQEETI